MTDFPRFLLSLKRVLVHQPLTFAPWDVGRKGYLSKKFSAVLCEHRRVIWMSLSIPIFEVRRAVVSLGPALISIQRRSFETPCCENDRATCPAYLDMPAHLKDSRCLLTKETPPKPAPRKIDARGEKGVQFSWEVTSHSC